MRSQSVLLWLGWLPVLEGFSGVSAPVRVSPQKRAGAVKVDTFEVAGPLKPLSNYMLIEMDEGRDQTSGGVFLAKKEKSPTGTIVQVGPGRDDKETGVTLPLTVEVGHKVLWGRYDGSEVSIDGKPHTLLREQDVRLTWVGDSLEPILDTVNVLGGNVLIKLLRPPGETASGIILKGSDDEISVEGEVIARGDGWRTRDGGVIPMDVDIGDCVKFRDFDTTEVTIQGQDFVVISSTNCICKWKPVVEDFTSLSSSYYYYYYYRLPTFSPPPPPYEYY